MQAEIEKASLDDVIRIGQMLYRFYHSHGGVYGIPYDHGSCLATVLDCVRRGICLVGRSSCAGAIIIPFPFNSEALIAQVLFWYIEHKNEISIFDRLMRACHEAGATHVNVATLAPKHTGKHFYRVRGLVLAEQQYIGLASKKPCKPAGKG